jgi:hypothetical protein
MHTATRALVLRLFFTSPTQNLLPVDLDLIMLPNPDESMSTAEDLSTWCSTTPYMNAFQPIAASAVEVCCAADLVRVFTTSYPLHHKLTDERRQGWNQESTDSRSSCDNQNRAGVYGVLMYHGSHNYRRTMIYQSLQLSGKFDTSIHLPPDNAAARWPPTRSRLPPLMVRARAHSACPNWAIG